MGTDLVAETPEHFHTLTRLFARENLIEFRIRESLKTYVQITFVCSHMTMQYPLICGM
jgi:TnpA family transposase